MTFLLFLYVQNLKGKDAFVYQLLSEAKFKVKLSAIDVRVDGCGNDDDGDDDLCDIDLDLMDEIGGGVHFSELDLATAIEKGASWSKTPSRYLLTLAMIMMTNMTTSATISMIIIIIIIIITIIVIIIIMHNNFTNLLVDIESSEWIC